MSLFRLECLLLTFLAASVAADLHGPVPLGPLVNSPFDDGSPSWSADGTVILFDSNRPPYPLPTDASDIALRPASNLWITQLAGPATMMPVPILTLTSSLVPVEFGAPSLSSEGDDIYFTMQTLGAPGPPMLMRAPFTEGLIGAPESVFDAVAAMGGRNPHISTDGNTLIFSAPSLTASPASNFDLFITHRDGDRWAPPIPLPPPINSPADEISGSLSADGRLLLFDSNRPYPQLPPPPPPGNTDPTVGTVFPPDDQPAQLRRGDFDVFSALRTADGNWRFVHRLGRGVNTPFADVEPALSPNGELLLFSSNRARPATPERDPIDEPPTGQMIPVTDLSSPSNEPPPGPPLDFDLFASQVVNELNLNVPTHVQPGAHAVITATWDAAPWGGPYRVDLSFSTPCRIRTDVSDPNPLIFHDDDSRPERRGVAGTAVWVIEVPHTAPPLVHVTVRLHNMFQTLVQRQAVIVLPGHSPEVPADDVVNHLTGAAALPESNLDAADANADSAIDAADVVTLENRGL